VTVLSPCASYSYLCPAPSSRCALCGGGGCVCLPRLAELTAVRRCKKLRIVRLGFGTARQKTVLERWKNPKTPLARL
jgi:hypothetical protein